MSNPSPLSLVQQVIADIRKVGTDGPPVIPTWKYLKWADDLEAVLASLPQPEDNKLYSREDLARAAVHFAGVAASLPQPEEASDAQILDLLMQLEQTRYGDRGLRFLMEGAATTIRQLLARVRAASLPSGWQPTIGECLDKLCGGQFDAAEQAAFLRGLADMLEGKVKPLPPAPAGEGQKGIAHGE
jgi:hypothetical protein